MAKLTPEQIAERRGMEKAAKLMCQLCAKGYPVGREDGHMVHIGNEEYLSEPCTASPIWNALLID